MPFRILALSIAFVLSGFLNTSQASALNLAEARAEGAVLAEALAFGEQGDWPFAEELAGRSSELLVRDVVLWRKLRAGEGSMAEYNAFIDRRSSWPGQKALAQAVFGDNGGSNGSAADPLSGPAAANWKQFSKLWKHDKYDEAEQFLASISGGPDKLGMPKLWAKRRAALARRAERSGRADLGYILASRHGLDADDGYQYSNLEWIAGWIALRRLGNPVQALVHFQRFNASVSTPISLGRGGYWLGRAYEKMGDPANASEWYRAAAKYPTSFYGQLAAAKLGVKADARLVSADLPDWEKSPALRTDEVRLAVLLHFAGKDDLALQVFAQLGRQMQGNAALGALGALTLELGQPHFAVRVAKRAARRGVMIYPAYYPVTDLAGYASQIEPALAMSISRQETELNPRAISPAGARGLMQLMPRTAKKVASQIGEPYSRERLLDDWQYNARLGQAYLAEQVQAFGGSYVLAAAAYNAGPNRADRWIMDYGDPRQRGTDIIDWIEAIPFKETRNYVQRVIEGLYVYRARIAGVAGPMTIEQDLARGVR